MPVPRKVTHEFFVPEENPLYENDNERRINEEIPNERRNDDQIDNLLHLFDLIEQTFPSRNNRNQNNQRMTESVPPNNVNDNKVNDSETFNNTEERSTPQNNHHQSRLDLNELESLLTELYLLRSERYNNHANSNFNEEIPV